MNGQQLTNSSNSANGTPTSPSSSYPASLSSQSSRDPSPSSRVNNALPAQIDRKLYPESARPYSQNHWQSDHLKAAGNLVNNFSSQPTPRNNPLLSNLSSDQRSSFVMPTPPPPLSQINLSDGIVSQTTTTTDTQSNLRTTPISVPQNFTLNNHITTNSTQSIPHSDLKSMSDVRRPSPQPTPPLSGPPRTNVQGTLSSTLQSQPRHGATSPVSTQDSSLNNAQINTSSGHPALNPKPTNPVSQIQRPQPQINQSVSTGASSSQFRFTSNNLNFSQTPVSSLSQIEFQSSSQSTPISQNQIQPPSSQSTLINQSQFKPPSSQSPISQNQFQPPNSRLNPVSQNQFPPPSSQPTLPSQNQFRPRISQTNPDGQNQLQPPSSQPHPVGQNQFPPSSSQPILSSQNQFRPPSSQANTVGQNQFQPPSSQPTPIGQSQFQPPNSQPNPVGQIQFQPPNSQPPTVNQNQFQPPSSQANPSSQNQYQRPSSQPTLGSQNQFQPPSNQYQQSSNKPSPLSNPYQQPLTPSNRYPLPAQTNQFQNSTAPSSTFSQPPRPNYPYPQQQNVIQTQPTIQQQHPNIQNQYNQFQQSQSYNLPPKPNQEVQGQNDFQHLPFNNQNAGQYGMNKRYPQMTGYGGAPTMGVDGITQNMTGMSVQSGFNKLWGMDTIDLLKTREILPKEKSEAPPIRLQHELYEAANCSPEIFRCTLSKIPETKSLLDKSRLPLGVLIHPFKDLNQLSVIQCTVIVRCRVCRTYINPFVYFVDNKRWKCNLCFRVNELPDEFQFDPMTKTYGDPSRRPEIKSATIEFIAPSEYMVRPPQPAIYVFLLDVSRLATECGYLDVVCRVLMEELDNLPGDARTSVAFITYDSAIHFYSLTEGQARPHQMVVVDIEDMFLPCPDNLLVNLNECHELIRDLLSDLPTKYNDSYDTGSALGAALQAAYKLLAPTGGRISVFQACLPNLGPGALTSREDPTQRAGENVAHLNPVTDFYKKLALDCSGQQIAVDLFLVNSQYIDLATLSGVSKFSGGCIHHFPLFRSDKTLLVQNLEKVFQRYLTRKIGFESVMRLRCTRGLSIHTFHGNFFVRSTDLLSLPNANPDTGFGMQVSIDENLSDVQTVCFQAALLYTSSKGERRIRVHTLCLPIASNLSDILYGADQHCIIGLLAKMAVDRSVQSSLSDAREAFVNVAADVLSAYKLTQSMSSTGCVLASGSLRLLPMYILALLKYMAFRIGQSTRLDDRVFAMCQMKTLPLSYLLQTIYPDLYAVHNLEQHLEVSIGDQTIPQPPRMHLSAERVDSTGVFLLDDSTNIIIYVGHNVHPATCLSFFDVSHFGAIPQEMYELPDLHNPESERLRSFVNYLQSEKPFPVPIQIIRDDSNHRMRFIERLIEDKTEAGPSYYEFLQRIKALIK